MIFFYQSFRKLNKPTNDILLQMIASLYRFDCHLTNLIFLKYYFESRDQEMIEIKQKHKNSSEHIDKLTIIHKNLRNKNFKVNYQKSIQIKQR